MNKGRSLKSQPLCPTCGKPIDTRVEYARLRDNSTGYKPVYYHFDCFMQKKLAEKAQAEKGAA